jgi:hypothetical protein
VPATICSRPCWTNARKSDEISLCHDASICSLVDPVGATAYGTSLCGAGAAARRAPPSSAASQLHHFGPRHPIDVMAGALRCMRPVADAATQAR